MFSSQKLDYFTGEKLILDTFFTNYDPLMYEEPVSK